MLNIPDFFSYTFFQEMGPFCAGFLRLLPSVFSHFLSGRAAILLAK
jgi:hypothetical protein